MLRTLGRMWWSRISLQAHVGPHAGECGDFLKELWPWRELMQGYVSPEGLQLLERTMLEQGKGMRRKEQQTGAEQTPLFPFPLSCLRWGRQRLCV